MRRLLSIFKQCSEKGTRESCRPNSDVLAGDVDEVGLVACRAPLTTLVTSWPRRSGAFSFWNDRIAHGTSNRQIGLGGRRDCRRRRSHGEDAHVLCAQEAGYPRRGGENGTISLL